MIQLTRRKRKSQQVLITVLPIILALLFAGVLILRSGILQPGGIWLEKPDAGNVITKDHVTLKLSALLVSGNRSARMEKAVCFSTTRK
jgi:cytochrome c biogenesis factor